jgi:hypothetical protein
MWATHIPNLDFIKALPVLCGREEGGEGVDGGQPGEGRTGAGEQNPEGGQQAAEGTGKTEGESPEGNPQAKIAAQQEIIDRLDNQRKEKDRELEELRKFKETKENESLSEQDRINKRIEKLESEIAAKDSTLQKLVVKQAFSSVEGIDWHDAGTALSLIDLSGFEIVIDEKTGIPAIKDAAGFKAAAEQLAKDKPFLVKTPEKEAPKEKTGPQEWQGGKTGGIPAPKQSEEQSRRARLLSKFPAAGAGR